MSFVREALKESWQSTCRLSVTLGCDTARKVSELLRCGNVYGEVSIHLLPRVSPPIS